MATYLASKNASVTINGVQLAVEEGSYTTTIGVDEVSNLGSGGFYEDVPTLRRATVSLKCVYDGSSPPEFEEGDVIALAISVAGGPGLSGNFRVTRMDFPVISIRAAVKYAFDAVSQGAFSKS